MTVIQKRVEVVHLHKVLVNEKLILVTGNVQVAETQLRHFLLSHATRVTLNASIVSRKVRVRPAGNFAE